MSLRTRDARRMCDGSEACSACPCTPGMHTACLGTVTHAVHDGGACLSACMPHATAPGARRASLVRRDMHRMPWCHRACHARWGHVSVGTHAARDSTASQRASLGAQGRAPHTHRTPLDVLLAWMACEMSYLTHLLPQAVSSFWECQPHLLDPSHGCPQDCIRRNLSPFMSGSLGWQAHLLANF